jgi:hypothetical protein
MIYILPDRFVGVQLSVQRLIRFMDGEMRTVQKVRGQEMLLARRREEGTVGRGGERCYWRKREGNPQRNGLESIEGLILLNTLRIRYRIMDHF